MIRDAVIPVRFDKDEKSKPELEGTAFLVRFRHRSFFVTARHCVERRLREGRALTFDSEEVQLKIDHLFAPNYLAGEEDESRSDIAVFEIDEFQARPSPIWRLPLIELDRNPAEGIELKVGDQMLVIGFPHGATEEPEEHVIVSKQICFKAALDSAPQDYEWKLRFVPQDVPFDLDNMSGSPVFRISDGGKQFDFAGMLTRGNRGSGVAFFIDARILLWALDDICING